MKEGRILVIDNDAANVALLEGMLGDEGFVNVLSATDPRRAVALCREFQPDLVLLDLLMPHLDGWAVLRAIANAYIGEVVPPIMVITADATPETKPIALAAGATEFLTKPFYHVDALLRIASLLELRQEHLAVASLAHGSGNVHGCTQPTSARVPRLAATRAA